MAGDQAGAPAPDLFFLFFTARSFFAVTPCSSWRDDEGNLR
jgi:hypothetical protein